MEESGARQMGKYSFFVLMSVKIKEGRLRKNRLKMWVGTRLKNMPESSFFVFLAMDFLLVFVLNLSRVRVAISHHYHHQ